MRWARTIRHYTHAVGQQRRLIDELRVRGLVSKVSDELVGDALEAGPVGTYLGADPSAPSLHLGNLLPLMVLVHLHLRGHPVFPLVGGATGVVGDPSGRKTERSVMEQDKREANVRSIHAQMVLLLGNAGMLAQQHGYKSTAGPIIPVNNYDWWKDVSMLNFLGQYGRHIRVSAMLGRESVKQRLSSERGIGFDEFTYQVLQAYDFWHLYNTHQCRMQIGGGDQWGNITAGIDLIGRLAPIHSNEKGAPAPAYGLTVPLLTTPSGEKFGKSAGNAIFLDPSLTRPYRLYQYLINSPDDVVEQYLHMFTLLSLEGIKELMLQHARDPEQRLAQIELAMQVLKLVHGPQAAEQSKVLSSYMFAKQSESPSTSELIDAFRSEGLLVEKQASELIGTRWSSLVSELSHKSKSEAKRLIMQKSVYIGPERVTLPSDEHLIKQKHIADGGLLLVRLGRTDYHAVLVKD